MGYLSHEPRNGTDDLIESEPFLDALREGYIVGVTPGYQTVANPEDFSSDAAAIQWVNDDLKENSVVSEGIVTIPRVDPNGEEFVIDETVVLGSRTENWGALPVGWGFSGIRGEALICEIDNGDPMFLIGKRTDQGGSMTTHGQEFGGIVADAEGRDAEFMRLGGLTGFRLTNCAARDFDNQEADGVYVFDSRTHNSFVDDCSYGWFIEDESSGADVFAMRDDATEEENSAGEIRFGPGISTWSRNGSGGFRSAYRDETPGGANSILFNGRVEGNGGPGIYSEGEIALGPGYEAGRGEGENTDDVLFEGYVLRVSPCAQLRTNTTGGHVLHIGESASHVIIPSVFSGSMEQENGDVIHIESDGGGSNLYVVPYEQTVRGSVTYPEPAWRNTVYPDGWRRRRQGTVSLSHGESKNLTTHAGRSHHAVRVRTQLVDLESIDDRIWYTTQQGHWSGDQSAVRLVDKSDEFDGEYEVRYVIDWLDDRESNLAL